MSKARQKSRLIRDFPALQAEHIPWRRTDYAVVHLKSCGDYPHGDVVYAEVWDERAEDWAGYVPIFMTRD